MQDRAGRRDPGHEMRTCPRCSLGLDGDFSKIVKRFALVFLGLSAAYAVCFLTGSKKMSGDPRHE